MRWMDVQTEKLHTFIYELLISSSDLDLYPFLYIKINICNNNNKKHCTFYIIYRVQKVRRRRRKKRDSPLPLESPSAARLARCSSTTDGPREQKIMLAD